MGKKIEETELSDLKDLFNQIFFKNDNFLASFDRIRLKIKKNVLYVNENDKNEEYYGYYLFHFFYKLY